MSFYRTLLNNHVLANLTFILVLVVGALSYLALPRQQDPTINFNWIIITTVLPGASAEDVEKKVTDPLEDALRRIQDVKFMSSNSRESVSSILIRFEDIDDRTFDKRVSDLRREIQNKEDELPEAAEDSQILEITSASGFPSATIAVVGAGHGREPAPPGTQCTQGHRASAGRRPGRRRRSARPGTAGALLPDRSWKTWG